MRRTDDFTRSLSTFLSPFYVSCGHNIAYTIGTVQHANDNTITFFPAVFPSAPRLAPNGFLGFFFLLFFFMEHKVRERRPLGLRGLICIVCIGTLGSRHFPIGNDDSFIMQMQKGGYYCYYYCCYRRYFFNIIFIIYFFFFCYHSLLIP